MIFTGGSGFIGSHLAELLIELVGSKVEPIHQESRPDDTRHSVADISEAKASGYESK